MDKNDGLGHENPDESEFLDTTTVDFAQPDALVGQRLDGRFLIEKNLTDDGADEGGIGVVYLARDLKLMSKEVVVKILQQDSLKNADSIRKFLHEKEALIRLDHPGVVRILDFGTLTDGNPFMVMEYIKGHSLRKELKKDQPLSFALAAHMIESITDALGAAHSKRIIHRDIKPANVMLTPQEGGFDRVRLIDFGVARVEESKLAPVTSIRGMVGTPYYMAPEQLAGELELTPAADIYATAIVAYELVTGELPFKPKSVAEMYHLEKEGVRVPPRKLRPDLPLEAEKLILSGLEFDVVKRPQNVRAFGRELAASLRKDLAVEDPNPARPFADPATKSIHPGADPTDFTTVKRQNDFSPRPAGWKSGSAKWLAAGVIFAALSVLAGYVLMNGLGPFSGSNKAGPPAGNASSPNTNRSQEGLTETGRNANSSNSQGRANSGDEERELSYFLMVQKMRNGKPFEEPFKSSGREVYESGYGFTMAFQPDADGYMYILNEGKDKQGQVGYYLLFPTPSANNGSAQVLGGREIRTAGNKFTGGRGSEVVWMIWTKQKPDDLEAIVKSVVVPPGIVRDENMNSLRGFLEKYETEKTESSKDSVNQRTLVKARGDVVIHRFELEHR